MKAANFPRGVSQWKPYLSEGALRGWRESVFGTDIKQPKPEGAGVDCALGLSMALTVGLFSLWLSLVLLGLLGLNNTAGQLLMSHGLRILVAAGLALIICIVAFPLFIPWLVVFVAIYLLLPGNSILRKWWLCTLTGSLVGVAGLWIDAWFYSLFPLGSSQSLNVPLLMMASLPAAVLGGATCFAATVFQHLAQRKNGHAQADDQTTRFSKTNPLQSD
jgi:hypothetical protein